MTLSYLKTYYEFSTFLKMNIRVLRMSWKIYGELGASLSPQDQPASPLGPF